MCQAKDGFVGEGALALPQFGHVLRSRSARSLVSRAWEPKRRWLVNYGHRTRARISMIQGPKCGRA